MSDVNEVNYTDEMVARLNEFRDSGLNWEVANTLAVELGRKPMSIVAKAKSLEIPYTAKERAEPKGIVQKKVFVKEIEAELGVSLVSMGKMTKTDLIKLRDAIASVKATDTEVA